MSTRKGAAHANSGIPRVDLKHVDAKVFDLVLRHIYADVGTVLFDEVITPTMDELMDLALEVMFVANELMIDRLAQACQNVLGRFGE
jgi:hypothetical protein